MFGKSFRLFKLCGFQAKADLSWLIIAVLAPWSLARGLFPHYYENLSTVTYWWMGIIGAAGLFLSIIFHELAHALVARTYHLPIRSIKLFIFGGVAEMEQEPPSAKSEFVTAIAGPIASLLVGLGLYAIASISQVTTWSTPIHGVVSYLAYINLLLAGFNLVPAFPLDGGRMLRAILWGWKKNLRRATKAATSIGSIFGLLLIIFGVVAFISGNFISGLWFLLIGMFLQDASHASYQQLLVRKFIEGEKVERFMQTQPVTVAPSLSLRDLVDDFIYRFQYKLFPVVDAGKLLGCITMRQVKEIPKEDWYKHTVSEFVQDCSADTTISPQADAVKALAAMRRTGNSRLMVVEESRLVGIVALRDMLNYLALKVDLEDEHQAVAEQKLEKDSQF
jgi:Zn-dependent protease